MVASRRTVSRLGRREVKRSAAVAIGSCAAMLCASVAAALPGDGALASVPANRGTMVQVTPTLLQKVASGAYPDVFIADWRDYTAPVRSWFVSDGIHYQPTGALGSADYLSRWITFMFDEPCPKPMTVGGPIDNPCTSPDGKTPPDVRALYG